MFYLVYNCLAVCLWPLYLAVSFFWPKAGEFRRSRTVDLPERQGAGLCLWLHAASVGELDQAMALVREIRRRKIQSFIAVSVFSMSVKKLEQPGVDMMFRMPVDFPWAHKRIVRALKPNAFVTMTWDVFPNLLRTLEAANVRSYVCSAALSAQSGRLKFPLRQLLRPVYGKLAGIGAVDEANALLFQQLHPQPGAVAVTGDTRYDSIFHRIETAALPPAQEALLTHSGRTWILASTYRKCDEEILPHLPGLLDTFPDLRVLIFPHFVEEARLKEIEQALSAAGLASSRFSSGRKDRVCVVDVLGILALAYRKGLFCYVGGGFHHRIHNTGEPAALRLPVLTGPRIRTSPVALLLASHGCLLPCAGGTEILAAARKWLNDPDEARKAGEKAHNVIAAERGSSARFMDRFFSEAA